MEQELQNHALLRTRYLLVTILSYLPYQQPVNYFELQRVCRFWYQYVIPLFFEFERPRMNYFTRDYVRNTAYQYNHLNHLLDEIIQQGQQPNEALEG